MRRLLALALVGAAAAPSSAAWQVSGGSTVRASTAVLVAVAAPTTTTSCAGTGSVAVQVRWVPSGSRLTGYELWRVRDGAAALATTVGPATTTVQDVQPYAVNLQYYLVSRDGSWRAQSPTHTVAALPLCT